MVAFEKSIGGVIYRLENGEPVFLLLKYPSGYFSFVKGHQEKGETDHETLVRETEEESGIRDLKIIDGFKKTERYFYRAGKEESERRKKENRPLNIMKRVVYYLAETKNTEVKISFEHKGYIWLDYEKALEIMPYKNSKNVLIKANEFLLGSVLAKSNPSGVK